jgi:ankyrin repeat protein
MVSNSAPYNTDQGKLEHGRSCPCKRVPLYLSSFTAAEHGNLQSLLRRNDADHLSTLALRCDSAGNTVLHLAAQHGHVRVVAVLLNSSSADSSADAVNAAACGATPLHRASFSGATATMRLLLERDACDLLARDTSFGDMATPLHKACSGGRYLAVQLLVETLEHRGLLARAVAVRDSSGMTPIEVARDRQRNADLERRSVARWDSVAGGKADWETCIKVS